MKSDTLGWSSIIRLGLVQTAIGAIVVIATSTLNRVMVVEMALPAVVPGALVALHHAVQIVRPRLGHGSDGGGRRSPWILGGMVLLALSSVAAAVATTMMADNRLFGILLAIAAFTGIGIGVGTAGTTLLAMLAKRVAPTRRAASATIVWIMMIAGIGITAGIAGQMLQPFSPTRLVMVAAAVGLGAIVLTALALIGIEPRHATPEAAETKAVLPFRAALAEVWRDQRARNFTFFVFLSMLAYSTQDLVLEPFAGVIFGMDPGATTKLTGIQHGGVLGGMILVGVAGGGLFGARLGSFRTWTISGCLGSAAALAMLAAGGEIGPGFPIEAAVFVLGVANGAFAVAAIGAMMGIASEGQGSREGMRMGLFGAAQAVAFSVGDLLGPVSSDLAHMAFSATATAYAAVFLLQVCLFIAAAALATRVFPRDQANNETTDTNRTHAAVAVGGADQGGR